MEEKNKETNDIPKDLGRDFSVFVTGLGMQALISLGEMPNPVDNKKEKNLNQAKYMIDILDMIKEKTKGNLTNEEANLLDDMLYQLRMKYLELVSKESPA
jgi:hypothetical protein